MTSERKEKLPEPIRILVTEIEATAEKSDGHTIEVAMRLRELKSRVENGEVGKVEWYTWAGENLKLRKTRLRALLRIAEAEYPHKEAAYQRELNARRQTRSREKQRIANLSPACRDIIDWARTATVTDAKAVLRVIETRSRLA